MDNRIERLRELWLKRNPTHDLDQDGNDRFWGTVLCVIDDFNNIDVKTEVEEKIIFKSFRLPKEFTEKWLVALRSGKYKQGRSVLLDDYGKMCCLGVACSMVGIDNNILKGKTLPNKIYDLSITDYNFPIELRLNTISDVGIINLLTNLNDGYKKNLLETNLYNSFGLKVPKGDEEICYSFEEIADWIERNVELY